MSKRVTLPIRFRDLERFVGEWDLANEEQRYRKMIGSSLSELQRFCDGISAHADSIASYLQHCDVEQRSEEAVVLFRLLATYVETAHPIEFGWRSTDIVGFPTEKLSFGSSGVESI